MVLRLGKNELKSWKWSWPIVRCYRGVYLGGPKEQHSVSQYAGLDSNVGPPRMRSSAQRTTCLRRTAVFFHRFPQSVQVSARIYLRQARATSILLSVRYSAVFPSFSAARLLLSEPQVKISNCCDATRS